jgi:acyl carrier protein
MTKPYTKEEIKTKLLEILEEDFEVDKASVTDNSNLFTELDFDSIDAVDLAVRLQQFTDKKISPEEFKQIRTIADVVNAIYELI